jgi:hypothetical protein
MEPRLWIAAQHTQETKMMETQQLTFCTAWVAYFENITDKNKVYSVHIID